jgi:hypothetical protein
MVDFTLPRLMTPEGIVVTSLEWWWIGFRGTPQWLWLSIANRYPSMAISCYIYIYQQYGWSPHLKVDIMTSIDPPVSCSQVQKSLAWLVAVRWRAPCNSENRGFHQFYRQRWGFSWWKWQLLVGRSFFFVKSRLVKVWLDEEFRILLLNLTVFINAV